MDLSLEGKLSSRCIALPVAGAACVAFEQKDISGRDCTFLNPYEHEELRYSS